MIGSTTNKPPGSDFYQQKLAAWQPLLTPKCVLLFYTFLIIVLFLAGGGAYVQANKTDEVMVRYDNNPECTLSSNCTVTLTVGQDMKSPLYVFYYLENFFQNHKRYVYSKSDYQLRGISLTSYAETCTPLEDWNGSILYPCGLIANSYYNDTLYPDQICNSNGTDCTDLKVGNQWLEDKIAWVTDVDHKFKPLDPPQPPMVGPNGQLPAVTDEHFIVWMRLGALPNFRKLYARLLIDVHAGDQLTITVNNEYDISGFKGKKSIILSNSLEGKNVFLAYVAFSMGGLCLISALIFANKWRTTHRQLGDLTYLDIYPPNKMSATFDCCPNRQKKRRNSSRAGSILGLGRDS